MNRKRTAALAIAAFICGALSFYRARLTALNGQSNEPGTSAKWLSDASPAVVKLEQNFNDELDVLIDNLLTKQKSLSTALEDPCTPNEIVLQRSEDVIVSHEHLISRVGEHVVELRNKLSSEKRDYLMQLCAETVRGPMSRLGGRAGGGGGRRGAGRGGPGGGRYRYGRGGGGRGRGIGYGEHMGARERLARRLDLSEDQMQLLQDMDPDFEADSADLRSILMTEREKLLLMFENPKISDKELLEQIENFISTHSSIERRITEHALVLRPYLTVEQQKWLIGLCRHFENN